MRGPRPDAAWQSDRNGPFWTCFVLIVNALLTLAKRDPSDQCDGMRAPSLSRLRWLRRLRTLAALILLAALALAAWVLSPVPVTTVPLVDVIDGDSLRVRQDDRQVALRLTGIDAVEYRQECGREGNSRWPCGREARAAFVKLAGNGPLHCTLTARDAYRRTLATCRTLPYPDGIDLGAEMVRQGWAVATDGTYLIEEAEARARRRGIWQGDFVRPDAWRAAQERPATVLTAPDA